MKDQPNHLINEKSPYLLSCAFHPIDWYPWCDEAFSLANKEKKLIFLSIGYSSCHWCHVMEKESFLDDEVADVLNQYFVSIKVDREERRDIDANYMQVCQTLTGHGGWPLTIILTPDKLPLYAGTYFPKNSSNISLGLMDLLKSVALQYQFSPSSVLETTKNIYESLLALNNEKKEPMKLSKNDLDQAMIKLEQYFDDEYGGFGYTLKFPSTHKLIFLLRYSVFSDNIKAKKMAIDTLTKMYKGGIFDHIGYGFARYATDRKWLIPHFEKMLSDNALLLDAYLEAYLLTKNELFKDIVFKIIEFVKSELTMKEGFMSAIDADSEHEEGLYYLLSIDELGDFLDEEEAKLFINYFGLTKLGNFKGKNVLNILHHKNLQPFDDKMKKLRDKALNYRKKKIRPRKDDKLVTVYNAMMISALARASRHFNLTDELTLAINAYEFINKNMIDSQGNLYTRYRDGEVKFKAYLDDYAYLIDASIELFLTTSKEKYLFNAVRLLNRTIELFQDKEDGGFFDFGKENETLLFKTKEVFDQAYRSANAILTYNLIRLSELTDEVKFSKIAKEQFDYFASKIKMSLSDSLGFLTSFMAYINPLHKSVLLFSEKEKVYDEITTILNNQYRPFSIDVTLIKKAIKENGYFNYFMDEESNLSLHVCQESYCEEPLIEKREIIDFIRKNK